VRGGSIARFTYSVDRWKEVGQRPLLADVELEDFDLQGDGGW